jgi:hypothetical protein
MTKLLLSLFYVVLSLNLFGQDDFPYDALKSQQGGLMQGSQALPTSGGGSVITLLASTTASDSIGYTSGNINTTGASLLIVVVAGDGNLSTFTDSAGNTWSQLTAVNNGGSYCQIYYCASPTTSATHSITIQSFNYGSASFSAWSGTKTSSPFDTQNSNPFTSPSATATPGSITPSQTGELLIAAEAIRGQVTTGATVGSSYNIIANVTDGGNADLSLAYILSPSTSALNPTFTFAGSGATGIGNSASFLHP